MIQRSDNCTTVSNKNKGVKIKEEDDMYLTDVVWWGYTAFVAALALFMLFFAYKVRDEGE
jgi:hypothetical protein